MILRKFVVCLLSLCGFAQLINAHAGFGRVEVDGLFYDARVVCSDAATCGHTNAPCGGGTAATSGKPILKAQSQITVYTYSHIQHCVTGPDCPSFEFRIGSESGVLSFIPPTFNPLAGQAQHSFTLTVPNGVQPSASNDDVLQLIYDASEAPYNGATYYACLDVEIEGLNLTSSTPTGENDFQGCASCDASRFYVCNSAQNGCECQDGYFQAGEDCLCDYAKEGGRLCTYEMAFDPINNMFQETGSSASALQQSAPLVAMSVAAVAALRLLA